MVSEDSTVSLKWNIVRDFQEDTHYLYILLDAMRGLYIPKREMIGKEHIEEVKAFILSKINKNTVSESNKH